MRPLSDFMSRILPHVSGCPDVLAKEVLVDAAIEFCEKTQVVRTTIDVSTDENTVDHKLRFTSSDEDVLCPVTVWFKGRLMKPVAAELIENAQAFRDFIPGVSLSTGEPAHYFWTKAGTIGLYPMPDATEFDTVTVRVALKPKRSATQLNDVLFDDWIDVVVAGTLARLHETKDQAWSSADRALLRAREFRAGVQRARMEGAVGRVRASLSVTPRPF